MNPNVNKPILLANPRGFCAGVDRAIEIVNLALKLFQEPIYVHHEVVHNKTVVDELKQKGVIFVQNIADVPEKSYLVFSAHGVSLKVREQAKLKQLTIFDATCPLVTKVHLQVAKFAKNNYEVILIGHAGHPEVDGTLGQYDNNQGGKIHLVENIKDAQNIEVSQSDNLAFVTQTTLSINDTEEIIQVLSHRFPNIKKPHKEDICYATQNRQNGIRKLSQSCDLILVVGSPNSSNSNRLTELAGQLGTKSYLIDSCLEIKPQWLEKANTIGIASGASAPEKLVLEVINYLENNYNMKCQVSTIREDENVKFPIPKSLMAINQA